MVWFVSAGTTVVGVDAIGQANAGGGEGGALYLGGGVLRKKVMSGKDVLERMELSSMF